VAARSWTSGDGPKAIFLDGMAWLRERKVLLPGATTLARLVAKVRDDTTRRLWGELERLLTTGQRFVLDQLLEVWPGSRVSAQQWRAPVRPAGQQPHQGPQRGLGVGAQVGVLNGAERGAQPAALGAGRGTAGRHRPPPGRDAAGALGAAVGAG
jgi:hypothetical protein